VAPRIGDLHLGDFVVTSRVRKRDEQGRFLAAAKSGAQEASMDLAETLAAFVLVNMASETQTRTGELLGSVRAIPVGATEAAAISDSDHAAPLETGSRPHWIPGAFGRVEGVFWRGRPGRGGPPGFGFFRTAEKQLLTRARQIIESHLP
jgi:hypothetical protein